METITYKPDRAHLVGRCAISLAFVVLGVGIAVLSCPSGIVLTLIPLTLGIPLGAGMGVAVGALGLLGGLAFAGVGLWMLKAQAGEEERIVLTPQSLKFVTPTETTTLQLDEVVAVEAESTRAQWERDYGTGSPRTRYPPYWTLSVRGRSGETIELQIAFPGSGMMSGYDVLPILRDLLKRLPDGVPVDPRMVEYAQTGNVPRIERRPAS